MITLVRNCNMQVELCAFEAHCKYVIIIDDMPLMFFWIIT